MKNYLLEVNPRASRSVPYVCKATGVALAKIAARCMVGQSLRQQDCLQEVAASRFAVKMPVFPFAKFQNADPILGPEMKSTGECMGSGDNFADAYANALLGPILMCHIRAMYLLAYVIEISQPLLSLRANYEHLVFV